MPRPTHGTSNTSDWREDLNAWKRHDPEAFAREIERVKRIYSVQGSIKGTAEALGVGTRTLERAMSAVPELAKAIDETRVLLGR